MIPQSEVIKEAQRNNIFGDSDIESIAAMMCECFPQIESNLSKIISVPVKISYTNKIKLMDYKKLFEN